MASNNIIYKNCIVKGCNKPIDDSFYDKSKYRPICSRSCYSKYIDKLPKRYDKKLHFNHYKEIKEPAYEYYKRGKLVLNNFNLNINW